MNTATRKLAVAAGALAVAALFGSLPFDGSPVAQSGTPVEHHDVALVDVITPLNAIIGYETSLDDSLYNGLYSSTTGFYAEVYNHAVTALGTTEADSLLGTTAIAGADGLFDGAANSASSGVFLETWAAEDELNHLLGISATTSEQAILNDIGTDHVVLPLGGELPSVGAPGFDADLMNLASGDFTAATSEFTTYLDSLHSSFGDLGSLFGELGGGHVTGLLGTVLGDLGLSSFGL